MNEKDSLKPKVDEKFVYALLEEGISLLRNIR